MFDIISLKNGLKNIEGLYFSEVNLDFKKEIAFKVEIENEKSFNVASICMGENIKNLTFCIFTDANIPQEDADEISHNAIKECFKNNNVDVSANSLILTSSRKNKAYDKLAFKEAINLTIRQMSLCLLKDETI